MNIEKFIENFVVQMSEVNKALGVELKYKRKGDAEKLDSLSMILARGWPYMSVVKNDKNDFVASYGQKMMPFYDCRNQKISHASEHMPSKIKNLIEQIISFLYSQKNDKEEFLKLLLQYDNFALQKYFLYLQDAIPKQFDNQNLDIESQILLIKQIVNKKKFDLNGLSELFKENIYDFIDMILNQDWSWCENSNWEVDYSSNKLDRNFGVHVEAKGMHNVSNNESTKYDVGLFYSYGLVQKLNNLKAKNDLNIVPISDFIKLEFGCCLFCGLEFDSLSENKHITINRNCDVWYNFPSKDYKFSQSLYPEKGKITKELVDFFAKVAEVLEEEKKILCEKYSSDVQQKINDNKLNEIDPNLLKFGILKETFYKWCVPLNDEFENAKNEISNECTDQYFDIIESNNYDDLSNLYYELTNETAENHSCALM